MATDKDSKAPSGGGGGSSGVKSKKNKPNRFGKQQQQHKEVPKNTGTPRQEKSTPEGPSRHGQQRQLGASPIHHNPAYSPNQNQSSYGLHSLQKHTINLVDGTVRSYYALPPDYETSYRSPLLDQFHPRHHDARREFPSQFHSPQGPRADPRDFYGAPPQADNMWVDRDFRKRKFEHDAAPLLSEERYRQQIKRAEMEFGFRNPERPQVFERHHDNYHHEGPSRHPGDFGDHPHSPLPPLAPEIVRKAEEEFLRYAKILYENVGLRKKYLDDGNSGHLKCAVCGSQSNEYKDTYNLALHAFKAPNIQWRAQHLGLHKALCVLMGWRFDVSLEDERKLYLNLSKSEATANQEDLIVWPPTVVVHNTATGKKTKDGRLEGMNQKEMSERLTELGFTGGKSKPVYSKEGHLGIVLVKFPSSSEGLVEAERLVTYFEDNKHGRKDWIRVQASKEDGLNDEKNPDLVEVDEKTKDVKRVLYGYLATVGDLDKLDFDSRKRVDIRSKKAMTSMVDGRYI